MKRDCRNQINRRLAPAEWGITVGGMLSVCLAWIIELPIPLMAN